MKLNEQFREMLKQYKRDHNINRDCNDADVKVMMRHAVYDTRIIVMDVLAELITKWHDNKENIAVNLADAKCSALAEARNEIRQLFEGEDKTGCACADGEMTVADAIVQAGQRRMELKELEERLKHPMNLSMLLEFHRRLCYAGILDESSFEVAEALVKEIAQEQAEAQ